MSSNRLIASCSNARGTPGGSAEKTAMNPAGIPALRRIKSATPCPGARSRSNSASSHAPGSSLSSRRDDRRRRSPRHARPTRVFSIAPLCFMTRIVRIKRSPAALSCDGSRRPASASRAASPSPPPPPSPPSPWRFAPPGRGTTRASSPVRRDTSFIVSQHAVTIVCAFGASVTPPSSDWSTSASRSSSPLTSSSSSSYAPPAAAAAAAAAPWSEPPPRVSGLISRDSAAMRAPLGVEIELNATPVTRSSSDSKRARQA
eukprot:31356-Pelagococcus_subviridis.AAC.12